MIELSIPQMGEESRNVKDLVFSVLTAEQPLSMIELFNRIRRQYNVSITYQAVRKSVNMLQSQGVLLKKDKKYSISKEWVLKLKSFFDRMLTTYESGKGVHAFTKDIGKENYAVYTLNSLFELDNFWGDILWHLADSLGKNEERISFNYGHYIWWMLINLGRESKLYEHYKDKKIKTFFVFFRDLGLNRQGAKIHEERGHKVRVVEDKNIDETVAVNTVGDTVIQVKYPVQIVKKIRNFFEKYKNTSEMSMKDITEIVHTPCEIKFIMFKNNTIAKNINETYLKKYFDNSRT